MKKSKTIFACAMLAALASCSNDHVLSQQSPTPSDPDVINIVAASSKPVTKAAGTADDLQDTQFANDEKINVYLEENGGSTTTYSMLRYKVSSNAPSGGGSGKVLDLNTTDAPSQQTPHYPLSGNGIDAHAYYPALKDVTGYDVTDGTNTFSVEEDQSTVANYRKSDLMFGTNNEPYSASFSGTKRPNPVNLYFKHLLSKIIVKLIPGTGLAADNLIGATVKLMNTSKTANITNIKDPNTRTISADNGAKPSGGIILTNDYANGESSPFDASNYSGCAGIIIPQDIATNSSLDFIEITLSSANGGGTYKYKIEDKDDNSGDNNMTFDSGYQYTYTITLAAGDVVVVSTKIENWQDKAINGNADLEPAP